MATSDEPKWVDFLYTHEGKRYSGRYSVDGDIVTVSTSVGLRSAHIGGMTAYGIARRLLLEMIEEGEADPD